MNTQDLELYNKTVTAMEQANVDAEYIQGWQGGFLVNPMREEQRVTEAYEAGYNDGVEHNTDNYKNFAQ